jgi:hypothetical protein
MGNRESGIKNNVVLTVVVVCTMMVNARVANNLSELGFLGCDDERIRCHD